MTYAPFRVASYFFVGSLLIQIAWIIALPPFRGIDEFDHAYRASAVAAGEWDPHLVPARHGRGWLLDVPRSMVTAASPICSMYDYTGQDNCHPVRYLGHGQVAVASAAANYNPVFYWMIGFPSKFFEGASSLLMMRAIGSLICSLLIGLAGWILASWASTRWPIAALALALSPMVVYSTALGAPNGVEMLGGVVVWAGLLGLDRTADLRSQRRLIYAAAIGAIPLVGVRTLGPFWLLLDVLAVASIVGFGKLGSIIASQRRAFLASSLAVAIAGAAAIWWTLSTGTNAPQGGAQALNTPAYNLSMVPVWILQSVAAFPTRTEQAPALVYACFLTALVGFLALAVWRAEKRLRIVLLMAIFCSVAVSSAISYATLDTWGAVWQGRYALPFTAGVPLGASIVLDKYPLHWRLTPALRASGFAAVAIAQTVSIAGVLVHEKLVSPLSGTDEWHIPPMWLVIALPAAGVLCWTLATKPGRGLRDPAASPSRTRLNADRRDRAEEIA